MLFSVMHDKRNNSCTDMQVFGHNFFYLPSIHSFSAKINCIFGVNFPYGNGHIGS